MGFISSVTSTIGTVVQGASDVIVDGPNGVIWREQLNDATSELNSLVSEYSTLNTQVTTLEDPINNIGKYTSAILHQSSDFVHGIAVNYDDIINMAGYNNGAIQHLAESNSIKPLIDLPIPGEMGGIPSALIPGVEAFKMVTGLVNMIGSSVTLHSQLEKVQDRIGQAHGYISQEQNVLNCLNQTGQYLLQIDNQMLSMFQKTCGVPVARFSMGDANHLRQVAEQLPKVIEKITNLKGNSFRTCRFIQNVIKSHDIKEINDKQIKFIANALIADDQIKESFGNVETLTHFINNFFNGTLVNKGMLTLPPVPGAIKPYLNEEPATKTTYSDPNSSKFDPPDVSMSGFPT